MRNLILVGVLVAVAGAGRSFHALAASRAGTTIQECATLLPKGKSYTYTIKGTIDTAGAKPSMHGSLTVSEINATSVATGAIDTEDFVGCVKALIKRKSF